MSSRDRILERIRKNIPPEVPPPVLNINTSFPDPIEKFKKTLTGIGGTFVDVKDWSAIKNYIQSHFSETTRIVSLVPELEFEKHSFELDPHLLETVSFSILMGHFGVAENGAIWITDANMGDRALPFITEHLALVLTRKDIVSTLHQAYEKIDLTSYNLGVFIAGPSKTADIEQSLVLGAHGAKSLVVFLME